MSPNFRRSEKSKRKKRGFPLHIILQPSQRRILLFFPFLSCFAATLPGFVKFVLFIR